MLLILSQIIGGLLMLFLGGEALVRGAVGLSRLLGMSTLVIGLTVVAFGTSMPELMVSANAAIKGFPGITLGNIIGSNISNILLVLGVSAMIYPITARSSLALKEGSFTVIITLLLITYCFTGEIGRLHGLLFLLILAGFLWYTFRTARKAGAMPEHMAEEVEEQIKVKMGWTGAALFVASGLALLIYGSDVLIEGSVALARRFGISESVIGLTLIATGSSAPELITSIVAAFRKHTDIALGNIVGSNIFNIIGIVGITSAIAPIPVDPKFLSFDLWVMLGVSIALIPVIVTHDKINRQEGGLFFAGYVAYVMWQFITV